MTNSGDRAKHSEDPEKERDHDEEEIMAATGA